MRSYSGRKAHQPRRMIAKKMQNFPPRSRASVYQAPQSLDVHELLKRQAFASRGADCDTHFEKNRPCPNSVHGVSDQYMILDSFHKVQAGSRPEQGVLKFNFMIQGVTGDQVIGVVDTLDTIIGIETCSFCIPRLPLDNFDAGEMTRREPAFSVLGLAADSSASSTLPSAETSDPLTDPRTQLPFCERVTVYLQEIGLQSYSDSNRRRHHFEFMAQIAGQSRKTPAGGDSPEPNGDRLHLRPLLCGRYYLFTNPIKDIHGLTVCFYNPDHPIKFPPDVLYGATVKNVGGAFTIEYTDPTGLINLAEGDRIYIRGFRSGHRILDQWALRPEGHLVGGITTTLPTTPCTLDTRVVFTLNPGPDLNGLIGPLPDHPCGTCDPSDPTFPPDTKIRTLHRYPHCEEPDSRPFAAPTGDRPANQLRSRSGSPGLDR